MKVVACENSAIAEAWCYVLGVPALFDEADPALLRRFAEKSLGRRLETRSTFVTVESIEGAPMAPFWTEQVSFDQGAYRARFGHRYLSVHFLVGEGREYDRFDTSLRPMVQRWLEALSAFSAFTDAEGDVERLGFGYTNRFSFPSEDFDVSRYFHVNFAVELDGLDLPLGGVETDFRFIGPGDDAVLEVQLKIDAQVHKDAEVVVRTRVTCEIETPGLAFTQADQVEAAVVRAKELAKQCFFALATEETHELMGVITDAVDEAGQAGPSDQGPPR